MLKIGGADEASFVMAFFGLWVGEIDVEEVNGVIVNKIGQEDSGIGADNPNVRQAPSADAIHGVAVVFAGPFDAEEIIVRLYPGLVEQEGAFAGADLDVDRASTSYNLGKIDFAIQIFGFQ